MLADVPARPVQGTDEPNAKYTSQMISANENAEKKILALMAQHRQHPNLTIGEYRQQKFAELETAVIGRKLVYLDLKYWIYFRDPSQSSDPGSIARLHDLLIKGVEAGRLVCPVSWVTLGELFKQPMERKKVSAQIMDRLSLSIALKAPDEVANIEFIRFFILNYPPAFNWCVNIAPIWTRSGLVFGEDILRKGVTHLLPKDGRILTEKGTNLIEKVNFDLFWTQSIEELIAHTSEPVSLPDFYQGINDERKQKPRADRSFDELFKDQLYGAIDHKLPQFFRALSTMGLFFDESGVQPNEQQLSKLVAGIGETVLKDVNNSSIVSQRVTTAIHADIRMQDTLLHKKGDLEDAFHAGCAVGYCDVFLTEHTLANRLKSQRVRNRIPLRCQVESEPKKALEIVEALLQET